ncbi:MAG: protein translocase subunit SecD, partial [Actinobacteria bacterium]|nr:protein translocase subunit SecD [Actinomycetota bacterium]
GGLVLSAAVALGALGAVLAVRWSPTLGLDLEGGISVVYKPAHPVTAGVLSESINIIRNRVDALGVSQPNIGSQGSDIVVQLPGVKDRRRALAIIGETAQLLFRPVLCLAPPYTPPAGAKRSAVPSGPPPPCASTALGYVSANLASYPSTPPSQDKPSATVVLPAQANSGSGGDRYELGPAPLTGNALKSAQAALIGTGWGVNFTLTSAGAPKWDALASQQFHKQVAIDLDGAVVSAPEIQPNQASFTSFGGSGQITGNFTQTQAKNLALVLQYGALPVQLDQQTVQSVSPTLGKSSLTAGLAAGLLGLALVMLYMIFYYRLLGVVVVAGLATTAAALWAIVSMLGHTSGLTLDLSGVTGLIVSIGITVDSYIVFFERLKDEVRAGRSVRSSVEKGFARAFKTILAADLVSFIAALVLWVLSIGPVKGFAFFLGLSTVLDVVSSWFFTRPLVILLGRNRAFTEARWIGVGSGLALEDEDAAMGYTSNGSARVPVGSKAT